MKKHEILDMLDRIAEKSPNLSRKTSAVVFCDEDFEYFYSACNTFPDGVKNVLDRLQGEARYKWLEHAERALIAKMAYVGEHTVDRTMFLHWYPCVDCARAIVNAGFACIVVNEPDWSETRYDFDISRDILSEGGVDVAYWSDIPDNEPLKFDYKPSYHDWDVFRKGM